MTRNIWFCIYLPSDEIAFVFVITLVYMVMGNESRALCILGKQHTNWATAPVFKPLTTNFTFCNLEAVTFYVDIKMCLCCMNSRKGSDSFPFLFFYQCWEWARQEGLTFARQAHFLWKIDPDQSFQLLANNGSRVRNGRILNRSGVKLYGLSWKF